MDTLTDRSDRARGAGKSVRGAPLSEMLNDDGFLKDPGQWSEALALRIAEREGIIGLDEMHWKIIHGLRAYFEKHGIVPTLSRACRVSGEWENSCLSCFFQGDPVKAVKIAGLPEPGGEVQAYYRGMCRCGRPAAASGRPGVGEGTSFPLT